MPYSIHSMSNAALGKSFRASSVRALQQKDSIYSHRA
jgi:hypothetical protein